MTPGDIIEVDLSNRGKKWKRAKVVLVTETGFVATHPTGDGECACAFDMEGKRWRRLQVAAGAPDLSGIAHLSARDWIRPILDEHFGAVVAEIAAAQLADRAPKFSREQAQAISRVFYGAASMVEEWPGSEGEEQG